MKAQTHRTIHFCAPTVHSRDGIVWLAVEMDDRDTYAWILVREDIPRLITALTDALLGPMTSRPPAEPPA